MSKLTQKIITAGVNNVSFMVPMRPLNNIMGIIHTCSSDEEVVVKCHISEERYPVINDYKITLEADDPNYGHDHFYTSDLGSLIKDGTIEMVVEERETVDGIDIVKAVDDLKRYTGLPPYDDGSNIVRGDGFYAKSLESRYGMSIADLSEVTGFTDVRNQWLEAREQFLKDQENG